MGRSIARSRAGIPSHKAPQLRAVHAVDGSDTRALPPGLGLTIARALAEKPGGTIRCRLATDRADVTLTRPLA